MWPVKVRYALHIFTSSLFFERRTRVDWTCLATTVHGHLAVHDVSMVCSHVFATFSLSARPKACPLWV